MHSKTPLAAENMRSPLRLWQQQSARAVSSAAAGSTMAGAAPAANSADAAGMGAMTTTPAAVTAVSGKLRVRCALPASTVVTCNMQCSLLLEFCPTAGNSN